MTTKVIIKGSVLVKNAPPDKIQRIKEELIYDNPKYRQAVKNGYYIDPEETPPYLTYFKERGSSIIVPRGMCRLVCKIIGMNNLELKDFTVAPEINISFKGKLRDYQEKAVKAVISKRYGILEGATGSGKTVIGTALTVERGVKTLVIVHNRELQQQWVEAFGKFTDAGKIGIIGGGKCEIKDITIGIINSVHKKASELAKEFGFVIYDETHRAIGNTWVKTINTLRPKFHTGLSATPYRSDGLTKALFRIVGPMLHRIDRKKLEETGAILIPDIYRISTRFFYKFRNDYSTMLTSLTQNDTRNILIANIIIKEYKRTKEPLMIVSDRVAHCLTLEFLLSGEAGIKPIVLSGRINKTIRKKAVTDLKAGKYNILISTVSLLGEGFDSPNLNGIFLTTPIKFSGRLVQSIGRVLRPSKGGNPKVFDFRDNLIPVLRYSGFARDKVYAVHNWG